MIEMKSKLQNTSVNYFKLDFLCQISIQASYTGIFFIYFVVGKQWRPFSNEIIFIKTLSKAPNFWLSSSQQNKKFPAVFFIQFLCKVRRFESVCLFVILGFKMASNGFNRDQTGFKWLQMASHAASFFKQCF